MCSNYFMKGFSMITLQEGQSQITKLPNGQIQIKNREYDNPLRAWISGDKRSLLVTEQPYDMRLPEITPGTLKFFSNKDGDFVYIKMADNNHQQLLKRVKDDIYEEVSRKSTAWSGSQIWKHKGDTILEIDKKTGITEYMLNWNNTIKVTMEKGKVQAVENLQALAERCKSCPNDVVAKRLLNLIKKSI